MGAVDAEANMALAGQQLPLSDVPEALPGGRGGGGGELVAGAAASSHHGVSMRSAGGVGPAGPPGARPAPPRAPSLPSPSGAAVKVSTPSGSEREGGNACSPQEPGEQTSVGLRGSAPWT